MRESIAKKKEGEQDKRKGMEEYAKEEEKGVVERELEGYEK